jgi:pyridoxamine 5'-phosphate oxidase
MQDKKISGIRSEYLKGELDIAAVAAVPCEQFGKWMEQALDSGIEEPNAMTLATVGKDGKPSARIVLLKGFDEKGFVFFTNYSSRKGMELAGNRHVALVLFWKELQRQVRIEGFAIRLEPEDSDAYFFSRPAESQVSAIISPQSRVIPDRAHLEQIRLEYLKNHSGRHERPAFWGGYRVVPDSLEFWQGREGRMHDRLRYSRKNGKWVIERLAP